MMFQGDIYEWLSAQLGAEYGQRVMKKFAPFEVEFVGEDNNIYAVPADTLEDAEWIQNLLLKCTELPPNLWHAGVTNFVEVNGPLNRIMDYNKMYCYKLDHGIRSVIGIR